MTATEQVYVGVAADTDHVSITATDEHGAPIGWAWLDLGAAPGRDNVGVEVVPEHRHQGVGTELVGRLLDVARDRGIGYLTCTHPDTEAARGVLRSAKAISARKVSAGTARDVVIVRRAA